MSRAIVSYKSRRMLNDLISSTDKWLILNTGCVPYIIGIGMRQWTELAYKRYPHASLVRFCGVHFTKSGSEAQFVANEKEYYESFQRIFATPTILETIYQDFEKNEKRYRELIQTIKDQGEEYLHAHYAEFIEAYDAEYVSAISVDGILVFGEPFFQDMAAKYPGQSDSLRTLVAPYGETFVNRYRQRMIRAALNAKRDEKTLEDALYHLQRDFHWLQNNYKNVEALSVDFFRDQLGDFLSHDTQSLHEELHELQNYTLRHREECDAIQSRGIFDSTDYEKLLWMGKIAWWMDRRKECNLIGNYYLGRHLRWLCDQHRLRYEDAVFLTPNEVADVLAVRTRLADYPIATRKEESVYFYAMNGEEMFLIADEARNLWNKVSPPVEQSHVGELKGMAAQNGIIRGTVRVVMDPHNAHGFEEGDILVTGMTRPDFLSLMKKAGGFITDEGGVTCHAAIIAREMKKPCVIGTKVGTRMLRTGDQVEVDAERGVIKILVRSDA